MGREFHQIALYGAGLIGAGWATHLLIKHIEQLTLYDLNDAAIARGMQILNDNMDFLIKEGIISADQKAVYLSKVKTTTDPAEALRNADLIIENGPENLAIKQDMLATIEAHCATDAVITSSTSGIFISRIVEKADHPERIFGAHPYHPVYLLPLLEIVKSERTDPQILSDTMAFFRSIDKKPVVLQKESDGYIGSHLMVALLRESTHLITSGVCTMQDIDDAFTYGPGLRYALMGIFTTYQLAGGENGVYGLLRGPIGQSTDKWLASYANWDHWPEEAIALFENSQKEMDVMLSNRDKRLGKDNHGLQEFRDHGLVKLLQIHRML